MKPETDPIADDEWLLRRVRKELFSTATCPAVSPDAFKPRVRGPKVREPDIDGISLYREACLSDPADILATVSEDKRHDYAIVRVPVKLITSLKLTVKRHLDPRVRGHVVIPEINADEYAADKIPFTAIKLKLAETASEEGNILRRPSPSPGSSSICVT